jgi:mono/diheme cytochrome c family protein
MTTPPVGAASRPRFLSLAAASLLGISLPAAAQDAPFPIAAWSRTTASAENTGSAAERGAAVFNNWCSACHSRGPQNAPGTTSLQFKYQGALPAALEDREDLTPEQVALYVREGIATMPFFRKTEIGDADLEVLSAYLVKD